MYTDVKFSDDGSSIVGHKKFAQMIDNHLVHSNRTISCLNCFSQLLAGSNISDDCFFQPRKHLTKRLTVEGYAHFQTVNSKSSYFSKNNKFHSNKPHMILQTNINISRQFNTCGLPMSQPKSNVSFDVIKKIN